MPRTIAIRFVSIVLAAGFTLAVLGSIDRLAQVEGGHAQVAATNPARA